jgi:hypothetical protein
MDDRWWTEKYLVPVEQWLRQRWWWLRHGRPRCTVCGARFMLDVGIWYPDDARCFRHPVK